ncbi:MAG: RsmE family RNA methyltransferase [Thermoanaerobaculia bacterium]
MNLLLIEPDEIAPDRRVRLAGRRARHLVRVLRVAPGRVLRAGVLGGGLGGAEVLAVFGEAGRRAETEAASEEAVELRLDACDGPPPPPPADLILALPRPKALRRILRLVAAVGVRRLDLVNAWRVERSYFASPVLEPEAIRRELALGAEQGGVPRLPAVEVRRFFVPFVEDLEREPARPRIVAHPGADATLEEALKDSAGVPPALAVGPEGGWIEAELESFRGAGFRPASLGPWTLTTEHAVAAALGQLALLDRRRDRFSATP